MTDQGPGPAAPRLDPVVLQVFQQRLIGIVREMRATMIHAAFSAAITELYDLSCAIMSRDGELIVQSEDNPQHIFPLIWSMREIIAHHGDSIRPDDVFVHNDPYEGGTHLNDIALIVPLFHDGELVCFPVVRAHWEDVGGATHGSISGQAREIFQEGMRIPLARVQLGSPALELLQRLMYANMRIPSEREGDFRAMMGTLEIARRRLGEVLERHGRATCLAFVAELMDQEERRMRAKLQTLRPGRFVYEAFLDPRADLGRALRIRVAVEAGGGEIAVDFTGSSPQVQGPHNVGPSGAPTGVFMMLKALLDPSGPINSGSFRPIRVHAPQGSFLNATYPAAVGGMGDVRRSLEGALMAALAPFVPDTATGDTKGTANQFLLGGTDASGRFFLLYEAPVGGTGGFRGGDGNHTLRTFAEGDFTAIQPIEAVEQKFPLRIEECSLREDSCGDGRWRGGLGLRRVVRVLAPRAGLSLVSDKNVLPPFGLFGGTAGWPNRIHLVRGGEAVRPWPVPGKVTDHPLHENDLVVFESSGGGGYEDPLERDPARVLADLALGYVGPNKAQGVYGVVVKDGTVDLAATEALRAQLRSERLVATLVEGEVAENHFGMTGCALPPDTATALGLGEGEPIEILAADDPVAPMRALVALDPTLARGTFRVTAESCALVGLVPGSRYRLRALPRVAPPSAELAAIRMGGA
jgi:N-methylhydantoinase B